MSRRRYLRLLPSVLVVGTGLLFLKGSGLVHEAYAQAAATQDAAAPATPAPIDYAAAGDNVATAAQVDVLTSLSKRDKQLDARAQALQMQANILAATEQRVDAKIAELKKLQSQISALVANRDAAQKAQIASLVKTYGPDSMKPASAAAIFATLPDDVLIPVARAMKPGDLGAILAKMRPEEAQKLTVKLANRLTLPDLSALAAPAPALPAATATAGAPAGAAPAAKAAAAPPSKALPPKAQPPKAQSGGG